MSKQSRAGNLQGFNSDLNTLLPFALIGLVILAYYNSLDGKFVFDDLTIIRGMQDTPLESIGQLWPVVTNWRGLLNLSYYFNFSLHAADPFGYHAFNLALHALNVVVVFLILLHCSRLTMPSFSGAAVYAVHPILTSAVASVSGRSSLMCATFYFLAFFFWLRSEDYGSFSIPRGKLYALLCGLAAFSIKQEAIALPLLLFAYSVIRDRLNRQVIPWLAAVPLVLLFPFRHSIINLISDLSANTKLVTAGFETVVPMPQFFYTYVTGVTGYLFPRFVLPVALSVDPTIPTIPHAYDVRFILSFAIICAMLCTVWFCRRTQPLLALGFGALIFSPLLPYAFIPIADPIFEHRAYIPVLGMAFIITHITAAIRRNNRPYQHALYIVLTLAVITTAYRNQVWSDPMSYWTDAVRTSPNKARPHLNLGAQYQALGRTGWERAVQEYRMAAKIKPDLYAAYSNIASIQLDAGDIASAAALLDWLTATAPDFTEGWINKGVMHLRRQEPHLAIQALDRALRLDPNSQYAAINKAQALRQRDRIAQLNEAVWRGENNLLN